jgi:hypothetical protein
MRHLKPLSHHTILLLCVTFLFSCSCNSLKKYGSKSGEGSGYGSGGGIKHDSVSVVMPDLPDSSEVHHVTLTSGEGWFPEGPGAGSPKPKGYKDPKDLKIVQVRNTRVVNNVNNSGRVVYKIPERMRVRSTSRVILRISSSKSTVSIYDSLQGEVRTSEIPVTQTMEVKLVDPGPVDQKYFEIVPDNNAEQLIENGETFTEWSWNVTPIRVGSSRLKIVVSIIRDGNKKDTVYEDSVLIEKDLPVQAEYFWQKYWQWLIGTFILPFLLWLWKRKREKKKDDNKAD